MEVLYHLRFQENVFNIGSDALRPMVIPLHKLITAIVFIRDKHEKLQKLFT